MMPVIRKPVTAQLPNGQTIKATITLPAYTIHTTRAPVTVDAVILILHPTKNFCHGVWNGKRITRATKLTEEEVCALERAMRKAKP